MARRSSRSARYGRRQRSNRLYLGVAVVVVAVVVYLLVRGNSGPEKASAGAAESPVDSNELVAVPTGPVEPGPEIESVRASVQLPSAEQTPQPSAPTLTSSQPDTPPTQPAPAVVRETDNTQVQAVVAQAQAFLNSRPRQIIAARNKLNEALAMPTSKEQVQSIKKQMAELSKEWLFGPAVIAGDELCDTFTVKRGDSLEIIGRRFKVPHEILMKINNIPRPESLQAGRPIKVVKGPFHVKVCRSTYTMDLYLRDTYVRSFIIGTGRPGHETPTGLWRVKEGGKLVKPTWTDPDTGRVYKASDADYPLGSRWIALDGIDGEARGRTGFAIHGTKDPDQIGGAVSRGCIRMYNGEVVLVYNMLTPLYSKVEVFD